MGSGSANVVEILVQATDDTAGGFASSKAGAEGAAEGMDAYAEATERATEAEAEFRAAQAQADEAQAQLVELQQSGAASADELAAAQDRATEAALASMDAQIKLGQADLEAAAAAKASGDASEESGAKADVSGGLMAGAGSKVKMAALGVAVGMGVAVKSAMSYQEQSTQLLTGAGELAGNLKMVEQGMLGISAATATSTGQLQSGIYLIESAGYHGADALNILKASAEGAKVGNADLGTVANAVTTVLTDYKGTITNASSATSGLVAIVASGKTHMEDLAGSMSKVLPTAAALKVPFDQVGGAIATMTAQGISAKNASMELNTTMISLAAPTKVQTAAMQQVGLASSQVASTLTHQGLIAAIQEVTDAVGKKFPPGSAQYVAALNAMLGGHRGLQVALALSGKNMDTFKGNTKSVSDAMRDGSKNVQGWAETQKDASFQVEKTEDAVKAMGIELGTALLPAVQDVLRPLSDFLAMVAQNKAASIALAVVLGGVLAGAIGGKLVGALSDLKSGIEGTFGLIGKAVSAAKDFELGSKLASAATKIWTGIQAAFDVVMDANPIMLVVIAIAALVAGVIYAYTHFKTFRDIVNDVLSFLKTVFVDAFHEAAAVVTGDWDAIESATKTVWGWFQSYISMAVGNLRAVLSWFASLPGLFRGWWDDAVRAVEDATETLTGFVNSIPGKILSALGDLGNLLFSSGENLLLGLLHGIESMVGTVVSAAENVGSSILSGIKSALGIGSPSRITFQHGQWLAQGLINGMDSMHGPVNAAASRLAGGAVPTGYGTGTGAAGGGGQITLQFAPSGGTGLDALFWTWLRQGVRVKGGTGPGSVQAALGQSR